MAGHIFLVAAEASGDALGADLMAALRARDPTLRFSAIGGAAMAAAGAPSAVRTDDLAILGFVEGLKAWRRVAQRADEAADAIVAAKPDAVVLIDSWGFTLRVAQRLKARLPQTPRIKYVGPQVWATRPGRAKTLAAAVDHLICIHAFETPFYAPYGLACTVAGNPALGRVTPGEGAAFRARHGVDAGAPLLLVLPGSRRSEVQRIGPVFWEAAKRLGAARPALRTAIVLAGPVADLARAQAPKDALMVGEHEKDDAFAAANAALAASGTVTTEVAAQGAPVIVGYKMGWITWALARFFLLRSRYISLMNVAAGREIAPEIIQTRFTATNLLRAAAPLLDDPAARATQIAAQNAALDAMGRGARPAAEIAAEAVLAVMAASAR
ncbi:MAG: lipid-A-disaccharide synthase [Hyphomonadaceae bacterium]